MDEDLIEEEKPIDLKKHQRYEKKKPWNLLIKAAVILLLFYLISYGINVVIEQQKAAEKEPIDELNIELE